MFKKGFTLIELLVVIAIIGILASVIIANVSGSKSKGRDSKRIADIKNLQLALELYYNDNGYYPMDTIGVLVPNYLPVEPKDPINNTNRYIYTSLSTISTNCTTLTNRNKYHLGAVMENDVGTNTALAQDVDLVSGSYFVCTGSQAPDFHGISQACTGASLVNPDKCYDVTN